jgi:tetratricopeptide (TPR) repeat protein
MTPRVLRRFIILTAVLTFGMFSFWMGWRYLSPSQPGDFETRRGGQLLSDGQYEEAIEQFNTALDLEPDHRGALQGRATAYLQLGRLEEAEDEFTYLIEYLEGTLEDDDRTGRGVLYSAYANRGTIKDRQGRYEEALEDYIAAIQVDAELAEGPGFIDRLLYHDRKPASVLGRANYLYEQLQLPEEDRLLRVPELDAQQRMYQP